MNGRIRRPDLSSLELPEVGRLRIGKKERSRNGKEYPVSVDYFIPTGKYAGMFEKALGDHPSTIQIVFPSDDAEKVCRERYEYRDDRGALVAYGDGYTFYAWTGKCYERFDTDEYPDIMEQITANNPTKRGEENWDIVLTMRFIIPSVRGIVGVWQFSTKGKASSVKNIRDSFDGVQKIRGTVTQTVFDLSVAFAKSNKPDMASRYPVVSLIANDTRIEEIRQTLQPKENLSLLTAKSE